MPPSSTAVATNVQYMESSQSSHGSSRKDPLFQNQCLVIAEYVVAKTYPELGLRCHTDLQLLKHAEKMFQLTQDMTKKHDLFFQGMSSRLDPDRESIGRIFTEVAEEIFDREWNFGRTVSLYAFLVTMVKYCIELDLEDKIPELIHRTVEVAVLRERQFIENEGWDGFLLHFTNSTEKLWRGILVTTIGLGALATLLYARP